MLYLISSGYIYPDSDETKQTHLKWLNWSR